jgi:hypothetical protein
VRLVEPAPARTDPVEVEIQRPRDLGGQRRATELDEEPVGRVAKLEVARVDAADPPFYAAMTVKGVSIASWRPGTQRLTRKTPPPTKPIVVSAAAELAVATCVAFPGKRTS